ncbi:unnamed protein product [Taenia asiatica]|uniref:Heat shock protein 4L n=1 Tax=Taenia asiatica TaxID=60517 RepID=A0A0R3W3Y0_TAEAS|nr:unnamed protein product [Taenia asiatica]
MSFAVVGFDVGSLTSFIGAAKGGGVEILANEVSERCTPSCVAFTGKARLLGFVAEQQKVTNAANTVTSFSRLIGKMESDPIVDLERKHNFFSIVADDQGNAAIKVKIDDEPMVLLPEQILAMHLHKLAQIAEYNTKTKVVDVVLSVPSYYTDRERRAFLDASRIAGLNCMRLVNETTAIGLAYGLTKKDLPAVDQPSRNVAFVSLGNSSLQVALVAFNAGKMKVISTACDPCLGGRDFDMCIFDHFVAEIREKYKLDVMSNVKARVRLLKSCEGLKKIMSTNSTEIPLNVECLMEDTDVSSKMKREFFEKICEPLLLRIRKTMVKALHLSKLTPECLYSVELVGGGTRIPAVKRLVKEVFGREGSTTLNADEAVARGCALQAAICSPSFKVREFSIADSCPYSITLQWEPKDEVMEGLEDKDVGEAVRGTSLEIFEHLSVIPASKMVKFYRKGDFTLKASYSHPDGLHIKNPLIGTFRITNIVPTPLEKCCLVRVKVRVNSNGIFTISSAEVMEKVEKEFEVPIEEPKPEAPTAANADGCEMETETQPSEVEGTVEQSLTAGASSGIPGAPPVNQPPTKPKTRMEKRLVRRPRGVPVESVTFHLSHNKLLEFVDFQAKLNQSDAIEQERQDVQNALEAYVYEMRNKLDTCLQQHTTERERNSFNEALTNTEDWIYGEGAEAKKLDLSKRLTTLKKTGDRYYLRFTEAEKRSSAISALTNSCEEVQKVVRNYLAEDPQYAHLSKEEMTRVENTLKGMQQRLNAFVEASKQWSPTTDPTILVEDLYNAQKELESICYPIITKPKPPPPPPKPTAKSGSKAAGGATEDGKGNAASPNPGKPLNVPNGGEAPDSMPATTFAGGEDMDVD